MTQAELEAALSEARDNLAVAVAECATLRAQVERATKLVENWRDAAGWEFHDNGNRESAQTFDQCANELITALAGAAPPPPEPVAATTDGHQENDRERDTCSVCRAYYPNTGMQVGPIWELWGPTFRVCRRCRSAGRTARKGIAYAEQAAAVTSGSRQTLVRGSASMRAKRGDNDAR